MLFLHYIPLQLKLFLHMNKGYGAVLFDSLQQLRIVLS